MYVGNNPVNLVGPTGLDAESAASTLDSLINCSDQTDWNHRFCGDWVLVRYPVGLHRVGAVGD